MAQIRMRIIFEGHFIQIFEYLYSSLIVVTLEKDSLMLIFKNTQTNIQIYSVVQKSTNKYPNTFVLGKWHKYKYE